MNRITIGLSILLLFFTADASAQKKQLPSLQWKIAGELPAAAGQKAIGLAGPAAGVDHERLLIAGGSNFPDSMPWLGGRKKYYDEVYVYRKNENDSLVYQASFRLPLPLAYAASCSTPEGILVAGGENEKGLSDKVFIMGWDVRAEKMVIKDLPALPIALTNAAVAASGNFVCLAGGETANAVSDQCWRLDLDQLQKGWTLLPSLPRPISHAVLVQQKEGMRDCFYLIGGRKKNSGSTSDLYASVFQFDIARSEWKEKRPLPYALSAGTGAATGNRFIYLFGGDAGETFHKTEELIAAINKETDPVKKQTLNQQKIALQSAHPGFCRQVFLYDTRKDSWIEAGCIPFPAPVTTVAVKWVNKILIPCGEVRAGVRTGEIVVSSEMSNEW